MTTFSIAEFKKRCPEGRLLGLDLGEKIWGLSLCDGARRLAVPLSGLHRTTWKQDQKKLLDLVKTREIQGIVTGFPLHLSGEEGRKCQSARQLAANIQESIGLPLLFWDERLSTVAVTRMMTDAEVPRKKQKQIVDSLAATYILQGVLDALSLP